MEWAYGQVLGSKLETLGFGRRPPAEFAFVPALPEATQ